MTNYASHIKMRDPGIYPDVPAEEYHADEAISKSGLMHFARSPAHYKAYRKYGIKQTDALIFGSAFDCWLFDGEAAFRNAYCVRPERPPGLDMRKTKADPRVSAQKALEAAWDAENSHKVELTRDQVDEIDAMGCAVGRSKIGSACLHNATTQVSVWWDDPETGVRCRGRLDWLYSPIILDVKTAVDASPAGFAKAAKRYSYDIQDAMYRDGMITNGENITDFAFFVVEKAIYQGSAAEVDGHATAIYRIRDDDLERARSWYRVQLRRYAECLERDEWPGYGEDVQTLTMPEWRG